MLCYCSSSKDILKQYFILKRAKDREMHFFALKTNFDSSH